MTSNQITQIRNRAGTLTSDPNEINNAFESFYVQLYTLEFSDDKAQMSAFFSHLDMPQISADEQPITEAPLQLSEIIDAIKSMHNGNFPKHQTLTPLIRDTSGLSTFPTVICSSHQATISGTKFRYMILGYPEMGHGTQSLVICR